jgi:pimeloyl-ACP methyl ester carboxylesterase
VVFDYGTPGTRWLSGQLIDAVTRAGVQLLVLDRPGYGTSSRRSGRRIIDVVDDVGAVVDDLGWEEFAVWGGSGGAPHALACAATLPGPTAHSSKDSAVSMGGSMTASP